MGSNQSRTHEPHLSIEKKYRLNYFGEMMIEAALKPRVRSEGKPSRINAEQHGSNPRGEEAASNRVLNK
jgi:hypothetical protein